MKTATIINGMDVSLCGYEAQISTESKQQLDEMAEKYFVRWVIVFCHFISCSVTLINIIGSRTNLSLLGKPWSSRKVSKKSIFWGMLTLSPYILIYFVGSLLSKSRAPSCPLQAARNWRRRKSSKHRKFKLINIFTAFFRSKKESLMLVTSIQKYKQNELEDYMPEEIPSEPFV